MEDPTDLHVMPAAPVILASGDFSKETRGPSYQLLSRAGSHALAASLHPAAAVKTTRRRTVLSEEEYVEALEKLVERDYFPQNAIMRRQLELLNSSNVITLRDLRNLDILEERGVHSIHAGDIESMSHYTSNAPDVTNCSIDEFFARFTSEDNESFERLQEKDVRDHRTKYHWVYEPQDAKEAPGYLMLYYMGDKHLNAEQRANMDHLLTGSRAVGDDRPSQVETWRFRVRNSFMFPPELQDSDTVASDADALNAMRLASGQAPVVSALPSSNRLLLKDAGAHSDAKANSRVGSVQSVKGINRSSTRLPPSISAHGELMMTSPLEYPHTPTTIASSEDDDVARNAFNTTFDPRMRYQPVAMTPSPFPSMDAVLAEQLITWGTLFGPPVRLDPPVTPRPVHGGGDRSSNPIKHSAEAVQSLMQLIKSEDESASRFQIQGPSRREVMARDMDSAAQRRARQREIKEESRRSASSVLGSTTTASGSRNAALSRRASIPMSPAAEALARRISVPSPFDIGLRVSYTTPSGFSSASRPPSVRGAAADSSTHRSICKDRISTISGSSTGALLTPRSIKAEPGVKPPSTSNLTDGLLKL
jgi:hypothetical protein